MYCTYFVYYVNFVCFMYGMYIYRFDCVKMKYQFSFFIVLKIYEY